MNTENKSLCLRIYISTTDRISHSPLYEEIVFEARDAGIAGVTVLKGIMGYGASSVIHSYKFWEISDKVPVVVEIIDEESSVMAFYETIRPRLEQMKFGCMVSIQDCQVLLQKAGHKRAFGE